MALLNLQGLSSPRRRRMSVLVLIACVPALIGSSGCGGPRYLKGTTPEGRKVYLGDAPQAGNASFQKYLQSEQDQRAEIRYFLDRLREAPDLVYLREGSAHPWTEAYRGISWLIRKRYKAGETNLREFIKKHALEPVTYIQYPNSDVHIAYYVIMNELDWLRDAGH